MKHINTRWSTNESLLQSYRSIFITTQSIFIGIGVFSIDKIFLNLTISVFSLLTIWWVWFPVVRSRHLVVDFFKYSLNLDDKQLKKLLMSCKNEEYYVSCANARKKADKILNCDKHWRTTRIKVDIIIPSLFTIIWIILGSLTICNEI